MIEYCVCNEELREIEEIEPGLYGCNTCGHEVMITEAIDLDLVYETYYELQQNI